MTTVQQHTTVQQAHFQSQMYFDDSVESTADSDLEDGELQKMLTSPLYAQKASGRPDSMVVQEREVSAQYTEADRKESLRSRSSEGQKALEKPNALFSSEQGHLIRSSVFKNANPSNLRGSLLEFPHERRATESLTSLGFGATKTAATRDARFHNGKSGELEEKLVNGNVCQVVELWLGVVARWRNMEGNVGF